MESAGERLKNIRLQKGISLDDAHRVTKIDIKILKAIEEDNFVSVSPVYLKGFLKLYCKYLNVDPQQYLPDIKEQPHKQTVTVTPRKENKPAAAVKAPVIKAPIINPRVMKMAIQIAIVVCAILLLWFVVSRISQALSKSRVRKQQVQVSARTETKKEKPKPKQTALTSQTTKAATPVSVPAVTSQSALITTEAAKIAVPIGLRLGIRAKDDCWLQIKIDSKLAFQNILKKGRFEIWQAKDKIELSVGNVGNIELELNGKMMPALGRKGQSVKNVVITKDGLKVER